MSQRLWPEGLWQHVLERKGPTIRSVAYREAARRDILGLAEPLYQDALDRLEEMLLEGNKPFDRKPGSRIERLLQEYEQAAGRGDCVEEARLRAKILQWVDRAVRSQFLVSGPLRKAARRSRHEVSLRADIADGLIVFGPQSPKAIAARERLDGLLRKLRRKDRVSLIAYTFRKDEATRQEVCDKLDPSLLPSVEEAVREAGAGNPQAFAKLKKRSQRAAQRAREASENHEHYSPATLGRPTQEGSKT